jgi:hypothetical protein
MEHIRRTSTIKGSVFTGKKRILCLVANFCAVRRQIRVLYKQTFGQAIFR